MQSVEMPAQQVELQTEVLSKFFRGLGDPTRVRIIEYLLEGDKSVGELVALLGSPQGRVSTHLACLRWCGYVSSYKNGRNVFYRVDDQRIRDILRLAKEMIFENAQRIICCNIIR
ncbi:MAG: metalloregulator ArsR/SmtB family transcription factor [Dehalococcoidales bacterium]|nr:metalloregulator ArsR/SmtB family transcription factor [Dehalococcoidales bacterium]